MVKCLIVDDEPLAIELLEKYVLKTPFLSLKGKCNGVTAALQLLNEETVDLAFIDIQMPGLNGIELSRILGDKIKVILTTAFEQYAVDGFRVKALGYLLKPFSYSEFLEASIRAKEWFDMVKHQNPFMSDNREHLFVKSEYKLIRIILEDIIYIEGLKDYVKFFVEGQARPIMSLMSLKYLEEKLSPKQFMRVHRSFIVNLKKIATIQRNDIMFGAVVVPVAEKYKESFHEFVQRGFLK